VTFLDNANTLLISGIDKRTAPILRSAKASTSEGLVAGRSDPQNMRYINATMQWNRSKSLTGGRRTSAVRLLVGILCVLLLLVGSTLQAAHSHPGPEAFHPDCALCVTAHIVAHVVATPALAAVAVLVGTLLHPVSVAPACSLFVFGLYTRPPPACLPLAS
jgi:hypothetical protein